MIVFKNWLPGLRIPKGHPASDQLQGNDLENLVELAARGCYDSLGKGRGSAEHHKHILEVGHYSVHEHAHFTVLYAFDSPLESFKFISYLSRMKNGCPTKDIVINRMYGEVSIPIDSESIELRVTYNLRHFTDPKNFPELYSFSVAPNILKASSLRARVVPPIFENEKFVSCYLRGSRGFSHEMVRHRYNISQRSTRYVNEADSVWLFHPHILKSKDSDLHELVQHVKSTCSDAYTEVIRLLSEEFPDLDRKSLRSAARGLLGNALSTDMIFTANISSWRDIFKQRCSPHADLEICSILTAQQDEFISEGIL